MFDASALLYRCTFPSEASAFTLRRFLLYCACEDLEANGVPPDAQTSRDRKAGSVWGVPSTESQMRLEWFDEDLKDHVAGGFLEGIPNRTLPDL